MKNLYNLYNLIRDSYYKYLINVKLGTAEIIFILMFIISVSWTIVSAINMSKLDLITAVTTYVVVASLNFYVMDGFKFSNYKILRITQKLSIYLILFLLALFILCYIFVYIWDDSVFISLDVYVEKLIESLMPRSQYLGVDDNNYIHYSSSDNNVENLDKSGNKIASLESSDDNSKYRFEAEISKSTADTIGEAIVKTAPEVAKNAGGYGAAAAVGSTVTKLTMKATAGMPVSARIVTTMGAGIITSAATKAGFNFVDRASKLDSLQKPSLNNPENTTASNLGNTSNNNLQNEVVDKVNESLQNGFSLDLDLGFKDSMTTLESMLHSTYVINILILACLFFIFYLILMYYIFNYNKNLMSRFSDKYLSNNIKFYFDKINSLGSKNYNRFIIIMLIFFIVLLIILVSINYYASDKLCLYLDELVKLHIQLKIPSIPILLAIKNNKNLNEVLRSKFINNVRSYQSSAGDNKEDSRSETLSLNNAITPCRADCESLKKIKYNGVHYWRDFVLSTPGGFLTENLIKYITDKFVLDIVAKHYNLYKNVTYCIILKVVFKDETVRCISNLVVYTRKNTAKELVKTFVNYWTLRGENYHLQEIIKIIISYRTYDVREVSNLELFKNKLIDTSVETKSLSKEFEYTGYNLPLTTDLSKWGQVYNQKTGLSNLIIPVGRSRTNTLKYNVFTYPDRNVVQVFSRDRLMLEFEDIYLSGKSKKDHFKRVMKNTTIFYKEGIKVMEIVNRKLKFIKPKSKDLYLNESFITLDIETRNINGILYPVCICLYDGESVQSFYITDFKSEFELIKGVFNFLNKRKYHYQKIYIHNMSKFDGVFLLKYLGSIGEVKPLMRHQSLYEIRVSMKSNKKQKYLIILRDSYLILPSSLDKLSRTFKVTNPKSIFPIFSVNNLPLDYIGPIPNQKEFISKDLYNLYLDNYKGNLNKWNLKSELIKYCENDVVALHQVINNFAIEIFDLFRIDIHKYLTLSSIALGIYQANFLRDNNIPKIDGQMFKDIFQSYKGGLVDMYIPQGFNLYSYDVNSEYPEAMCLDMPGGYVQFIKGDLSLKDKNIFGFFKAEIIAPDNLSIPVLPVKYKGNTLCPLGKWTDWYFSEELREAEKYGYKIKLLQGYNFQRKNLFKEYVEILYSIKEQTNKDDPKYAIVKFILNMTYGRFGMNPVKETSVVVSKNKAIDFLMDSNKDIIDHYVFDNGTEFVRYVENLPEEKTDNVVNGPNVSIAIASAVVASCRIKINQLKHLKGVKIYYSDTDSVYVDKPLPSNLIGTKLGQLKLENHIKIGYFIAPKVYGLVNENLDNIVKVKGLKSDISFYELNVILYKNSTITKYQEKWYRRWDEGKIYIRNEIYSLIVTNNKRQLIYDSCSKLIGTRPYIYVNGTIINKYIDYVYNIKGPTS